MIKKISAAPLFLLVAFASLGCAANVSFVQTDEAYMPVSKPDDAVIVFRHDKIQRPHQVIGVIDAQLGKHAGRAELDSLLIKKER